jgi:hypothetical protein
MAVFQVSTSPRNTTDRSMAIATLNLSTGATCETFPTCNALNRVAGAIENPRESGRYTRQYVGECTQPR